MNRLERGVNGIGGPISIGGYSASNRRMIMTPATVVQRRMKQIVVLVQCVIQANLRARIIQLLRTLATPQAARSKDGLPIPQVTQGPALAAAKYLAQTRVKYLPPECTSINRRYRGTAC